MDVVPPTESAGGSASRRKDEKLLFTDLQTVCISAEAIGGFGQKNVIQSGRNLYAQTSSAPSQSPLIQSAKTTDSFQRGEINVNNVIH